MGKKSLRSGLFTIVALIAVVSAVLILQQVFATPVAAQSPGCIDATGLPCTPTPPRHIPPTKTPVPLPTRTHTVTPSPTITPTPTATNTLIPSPTPNPTPTFIDFPPLLKPITNFVGRLHIVDSSVVQLPSWLAPDNIKVTDVEITQVIQCMRDANCPDNSVPLYQNKLTLVRVYVRLTAGPDNIVYPIGGALCYGDTGAGGCPNPVLPVQKIYVHNVNDPVKYGRGLLSTTLNFILPMSYVQSPVAQTFTVYVNYNFQDLPQESFYKDNHRAVQYQVQPSEPLYIRFYPVQDNGLWPPAMEWATITDYLSRTYPTGAIYPSLGFPLYNKNYAWTVPDKWGCPKGWHDLINDLWSMRAGSGPIAYGEVNYQALSGGVTGCGVLGGPEAAGLAGATTDGRTAAQEVGHTMNLPHVPGCGAGGPDMNYPEPYGLLDKLGTDVENLKLYSALSAYDFMGYCGGGTDTWTSLYTYNEIAGLLPQGAFHRGNETASTVELIALSDQHYLVGSGDLSPTAAKLTQGFYLLDRASVNPPTPDRGPYTVELLDVNGQLLYSQHFDLAQMSNDEPQTEGGFQLVLPYADGTHRVVFKYGDKVIGQVTASAHAPSLQLASPAGGEHWTATGQQTVAWSAGDADGNPLSYLVQFSPDGGATWSMMATDLTSPSFTFDAQYLPGSTQGLIRVSATDGLNTAQAVSGPITVDPQAPLLAIASPQDGQSFDAGTPVVLRGYGADLNDGSLPGDRFQWSDDRDGGLGSGDTLVTGELSVGEHTLTLSATNGSGLTGSATVHITIKTPEKLTPIPARSALLDFLVPLGIPLVVAAGIVLAVARARRKKARGKGA